MLSIRVQGSKHEAYINVVEIKGATRAFTGEAGIRHPRPPTHTHLLARSLAHTRTQACTRKRACAIAVFQSWARSMFTPVCRMSYVCVRVCVCVCVCVCVRVCVCMHAAEDAEKRTYVPIAAFECRGLEPVAYRFEVRTHTYTHTHEHTNTHTPESLRRRQHRNLTIGSLCMCVCPRVRACMCACRDVQGDWLVEAANSKTKWDDVDLSEGEWTEYDEKSEESVGIFNVEAE